MTWAALVLALVTAQRIGELAIARANTRRLLRLGGFEVGAGHYPLVVALHAAWLATLWLMAWNRGIELPWLAAYALLQALRVWALASMGRRWTTRIIIVPGETLVRRGPYRFLPHPNYLVVMGEIAVLPMVFGLWGVALIFSALNAAVLAVRISVESKALAARRGA